MSGWDNWRGGEREERGREERGGRREGGRKEWERGKRGKDRNGGRKRREEREGGREGKEEKIEKRRTSNYIWNRSDFLGYYTRDPPRYMPL